MSQCFKQSPAAVLGVPPLGEVVAEGVEALFGVPIPPDDERHGGVGRVLQVALLAGEPHVQVSWEIEIFI